MLWLSVAKRVNESTPVNSTARYIYVKLRFPTSRYSTSNFLKWFVKNQDEAISLTYPVSKVARCEARLKIALMLYVSRNEVLEYSSFEMLCTASARVTGKNI